MFINVLSCPSAEVRSADLVLKLSTQLSEGRPDIDIDIAAAGPARESSSTAT
jgi:hypothetical protein